MSTNMIGSTAEVQMVKPNTRCLFTEMVNIHPGWGRPRGLDIDLAMDEHAAVSAFVPRVSLVTDRSLPNLAGSYVTTVFGFEPRVISLPMVSPAPYGSGDIDLLSAPTGTKRAESPHLNWSSKGTMAANVVHWFSRNVSTACICLFGNIGSLTASTFTKTARIAHSSSLWSGQGKYTGALA